MDVSGGYLSSYDGAAGTIYKRTAGQGPNEGTMIVDSPYNGTWYTSMDPLVEDKSVGEVIIKNNGELQVPSGETLYVRTTWSNDNTFVAETDGRVEFIGTDTLTVYGDTTFKEFVCTNVAKQINFEAGATTDVDEDFLISGSGGPNLVLRSTSDGTQWLLDVDAAAAQTVENVDVKDSNADSGATVSATTSTDSGNNSNWVFAAVGVTNIWLGGVDTGWSTGGNWDQGRPPIAGDLAVVISNGTFDPILPSAQEVNDFIVDAGAALDMGTYDFTIKGDADINGSIIAQTTEMLTFEGDVDFTGGAFNQSTSTLVLAGSGAQSVTSAGESYYGVTVTNSGRTVTFTDAASATTFRNESVGLTFSGGITATEIRSYSWDGAITHTFGASSSSTITDMYLLGESGNVITLVSSTPTTQWSLDVDRIAYAKYVNVTDSDANAGMTIYPISSADGGNNDNWSFAATWLTWDGSTSADFGTADNWTPSGTPDGTKRLNIDGNGGNAPVISSAAAALEILLGGDQTSSLTINNTLTVGGDVRVMSFGTLTASKPSTIGGDLTLLDGALLTHSENTSSEAYKIDLTVAGNLYLGEDAEIDVDYRGYASGGPGYGPYAFGASHGGQGGAGTGPAKDTYGSIIAPTNIGSAGMTYDGGGAVKLTVSGETRLYGYVHANGESVSGYSSGASGGSIFLTTSNLVGDATLEAEGGNSESYGAGGGGRISVVLTSGTSFDQVTMKVRGGVSGGTTDGANGTIYKQIGTDAAGAGTVIVDCDGRAPDSSGDDSATSLLPDTLYVPDELENALLIITNSGTHVRASESFYVGELLVYENTEVTLGVYTMFVYSLEHHLDDRTEPGAGGPTNNVDDYSHIVWIGQYPGTIIMFQ